MITRRVCAHGHSQCPRQIDDAYFLRHADCEFVLGYLLLAETPRYSVRSGRNMLALGHAPVGRVPAG